MRHPSGIRCIHNGSEPHARLSGGGAGGRPPGDRHHPSSGDSGNGDGGDDEPPWAAIFGRPAAIMAAVALVAVGLGAAVPRPAWAAAAGGAASAASGDAALLAPRSVKEEIAALKRLQRETFAQLLAANARLDALTPPSEDVQEEVPLEGVTVAPIKLPAASDGVRAKAAAVVSGTLDIAPAVVVAVPQPSGDDGAEAGTPLGDAPSSTGSAPALAVRSGPTPLLLLQTLFPSKKRSLAAVLGGRTAPDAGVVPCCRAGVTAAGASSLPSSAAGGAAAASGTAQLSLQQLVFKSEVGPHLRVMVAPLGGALQHIARRVNPWADVALTAEATRGHGLAPMWEAGTGAGATLFAGPLSVSAAHLVGGSDGAGGGASRAPAEALRQKSVGLVGIHVPDALAVSLVGIKHHSRQLSPLSLGGSGDGSMRVELPGCTGSPSSTTSSSSTGADAVGASAAINVAQLAVVSGWGLQEHGGPRAWGARLATLPGGDHGITLTAALSQAASGSGGDGGEAKAQVSHATTFELSCKVPVADGAALVPGVVVVHREPHAAAGCSTGAQTHWAFVARALWSF